MNTETNATRTQNQMILCIIKVNKDNSYFQLNKDLNFRDVCRTVCVCTQRLCGNLNGQLFAECRLKRKGETFENSTFESSN